MKNEQKREYAKPQLSVLEIKVENTLLLVGSGDEPDDEREMEVDFIGKD
ncbi:MAG: hypothetical protein IKX42_09265 [Fibrobacter sp.]|nr:hypothetical protein [Fibrobacter sp.]